ncbi:MAG: Rid family hydrolase [Rikenellaceae bacterium]|nr:Rid family hydrolase [Rikenellaceae bacterium]
MDYNTLFTNGCVVQISAFTKNKGVSEYNFFIHTSVSGTIGKQIASLHGALADILNRIEYKNVLPLFKKYFARDVSEVSSIISGKTEITPYCTTSLIQQPPLDGSEIALWVFGVTDFSGSSDNVNDYSHNGYTHVWTAGIFSGIEPVKGQTMEILEEYDRRLFAKGGSIKDNCLRTWFFVDEIDNNYSEFVEGRKRYFSSIGLDEKTHYIASTGICGSCGKNGSIVSMDAYALIGLDEAQVKYLYSKDHLCSTYDYGVTFERGVTIQYGDRRHVIISGTASIDNHGNILFVNDIKGQTLRMWENVEVLLREAEADFADVSHIIVYLRNRDDYAIVENMFSERFPYVPCTITLAPVCRPGWLIEMECMATLPLGNGNFRNF